MRKKEVATIVIFLVIGLAAIAVMFYSENVGQAWYVREEYRSISYKPDFPPEAAYYLQPGKYTTPDYEIKQIRIKPISPMVQVGPSKTADEGWIAPLKKPWEEDRLEFNLIRGIFKYMDSFPSYKKDDDNSWDLTVKRGLNKNYCDQYGRLFVALARANGIPAKYLTAYRTEWSDKQKRQGCWDGTTSGHVFAKVYVDGNWYGVDPTRKIFIDMDDKGNSINNRGTIEAITFAEGKDHGDTLPYINRWCLEGLRYHKAISGLLLCENPESELKTDQLMMMLACKEPLKTVEFQKKSER